MTFLTTTTVHAYAQAVRDAMGDLPADQASAVLDGLDEHLAEVVADGAIDLEAVLGPPATYAAELRASAGLPASSTRPATAWSAPAPPVAPSPTQDTPRDAEGRVNPLPPRRRAALAVESQVTAARLLLGAAFGIVAIITIRYSSLPQLVLAFLAIAGALSVLRRVGNRAQLSEPWAARLPLALAAAGVLAALLIGAHFGTNNSSVVYVDRGGPGYQGPSTTFATIPVQSSLVVVPDMVGNRVDVATATLNRIGLTVAIHNGDGLLAESAIITKMTPSPGTSLGYGYSVTVDVAPEPVVAATTAQPGGSSTLVTASTAPAPPSTAPAASLPAAPTPSVSTGSVSTATTNATTTTTASSSTQASLSA